MDRTVMMTLTSEYALRAMIYLAQHNDAWPLSGTRIAAETGVSRKYLSKILADLVRARVLVASRGKSGGFRLARSPEQIRVAEVLGPFEPVLGNRRPCPFGNPVCNDDDPCAGHFRWMTVRTAYYEFVNETSVRDLAITQRDVSRSGPGKRKQRSR